MTGVRTWHHHDFPAPALVEAKAGHTISVCIPARDESATVGAIVGTVVAELVERWALVDEVVVVDDGSLDDTMAVAARAGATVFRAGDVLPEAGPGEGKGEALWKALHVSTGDMVVFCDADVRQFQCHFITGVLGPLLLHDDLALVKGFYERLLDGTAGEGGRVTELVAKPVISLLFPHLAGVAQPLGGEYAARRQVLEQVPFIQGYGVDLGLLIDVCARFGVTSLGQVDLGARAHRNRPLQELRPQAQAVLQAAFGRAGVPYRSSAVEPPERPPKAAVSTYRRTA